MSGCSDCGRKGGCDHRKQAMFAAMEEAMARLYPTRRWGERDEAAAAETALASAYAIEAEAGPGLAAFIAERLGTAAFFQPGSPDEWCDYIYVLCLGRQPSIYEIREGAASGRGEGSTPRSGTTADQSRESEIGSEDDREDVSAEAGGGEGHGTLEERYLRVALSSLAPFATVQEIAMTLVADQDALIVTERSRAGVFDPILLRRFQMLTAALVEWGLRTLDFGELIAPPAGFDGSGYRALFGEDPLLANYLFSPRPPAAVTTVVLPVPLAAFG